MDLKSLPWGLVLGLGALALIRPIVRMTGVVEGSAAAVAAAVTTALITMVWVLVIGLSRVPRPFLTSVAVGLVYALLAVVLSAIASPLLDGELRGPLTNPFALAGVLLVNALWGAGAGVLAAGLQGLRRPAHGTPGGHGPVSEKDR